MIPLDLVSLHSKIEDAVESTPHGIGVLEVPQPLRVRVSKADMQAMELIGYIFNRWPETTPCQFKTLLANAQWWVTFLGSQLEEGDQDAD